MKSSCIHYFKSSRDYLSNGATIEAIGIITNMKIINNTDINNLIYFAKKNLGIYKLVYREEKKIYYFAIISVLISIFILLTYILLIFLYKNNFLGKLCGICGLFTCLISLILLKHIDNKTKNKHLKIQEVRFRMLKKYYNDENYTIKDIKIINQQLEKRIEKIEKQKVTILVVISVMILPIWDIFVQEYFKDFSLLKMEKIFMFLFVFSIIILAFVRFLNKTLYLYEENFYIKNNIAIIENLIYLNKYIIQEKEEQINHGRRK